MFSATGGSGLSFNQLHAKCGGRIKQQIICPVCNEVVERNQLVKGYEFAKDQYVQFTPDELKALEGESSPAMDIVEFLPLKTVDPIYFDRTYYLGPDKGGEKAYRLLSEAMNKTERCALARVVMRGKESLVIVRPAQGGLLLHTMYFAREVRDFGEIDKGDSVKIKSDELDLALQIIKQKANTAFKPESYTDDYYDRVMEQINRKVEGKEITSVAPETQRAQVIDLMDALKQSLEKRGAAGGKQARKPAAKAARTKTTQGKKKVARG